MEELGLGEYDKLDESEYHVHCVSECNNNLTSKGAYTPDKDICIKVLENVIKLTRSDPKLIINLRNSNNWLYDNDIFYKIDKDDISYLYTKLCGYIMKDGYMQQAYEKEDLFTKSIYLDKIVKILNFSPLIETIKSTMTEKTNTNYSKCCNYIKECVELYDNIKNETCSSKVHNSFFCKPLQGFKKKYETIFSTLKGEHHFPSSLDEQQKIDI